MRHLPGAEPTRRVRPPPACAADRGFRVPGCDPRAIAPPVSWIERSPFLLIIGLFDSTSTIPSPLRSPTDRANMRGSMLVLQLVPSTLRGWDVNL